LAKKPAPHIAKEVIENIKNSRVQEAYITPINTPPDVDLPPQPITEETAKNIIQKMTEEKVATHYRFGRAVDSVKLKFIEFVSKCIDKPGPFIVDPLDAANELGFNRKTVEVFLDRLSLLKMGTKKLVNRNLENEWISNFSAQEIIDYATEIVED
jgi:hypothetical protein